MTAEEKAEIASFVAERDAVLLRGDLDELEKFHGKHNPGQKFSSRQVLEISLHKARTAVLSLPVEARAQSKQWLIDRGYASWDDGEPASA